MLVIQFQVDMVHFLLATSTLLNDISKASAVKNDNDKLSQTGVETIADSYAG